MTAGLALWRSSDVKSGAHSHTTPTIHLVDVGVVRPAVVVQEVDRVVSSVAGEMAVVAFDHGQAGAHVAGEIEG
jgi:hypothetical protein